MPTVTCTRIAEFHTELRQRVSRSQLSAERAFQKPGSAGERPGAADVPVGADASVVAERPTATEVPGADSSPGGADSLPEREGVVVGFVPTMGALHAGHGALLRTARQQCDVLVASVFVNPLQFNDPQDYVNYPRDLAADQQFLSEHGVDVVFAPDLDQMYPGYPHSPVITISTGKLGTRWEGASRPGHFDGVATVVAKLFTIVSQASGATPVAAWFGEKDAEQLAVVRQLVRDMNLPVEIHAQPIIRDDNGLALSSRNQRLSAENYQDALALPRALEMVARRGAEVSKMGWAGLGLDELRDNLQEQPGVELDYLAVVDPMTMVALDAVPKDSQALALIAATVGPVRLIDNRQVTFR